MSDKAPDERDIDDILASIDAMLLQKEAVPTPVDPKKEVIEQAKQQSERTLAISSTPPLIEPEMGGDQDKVEQQTQETDLESKQQALDEEEVAEAAPDEGDVDEDEADEDDVEEEENITSRHRVLLTEALLEPSAQEMLPLWVEQTETTGEEISDDVTSEGGISEQPVEAVEQVHQTIAQPSSTLAAASDATESNDLITINRDQLEQLVEVISRDVARQVNQQMQDLLPKLVSASLVRHLASLKKDDE